MPMEITGNYIRIRMMNPDKMQDDTIKTVMIDSEKGIKAIMGKMMGKDTMSIQAYLFDIKKWTEEKAKEWVEHHK